MSYKHPKPQGFHLLISWVTGVDDGEAPLKICREVDTNAKYGIVAEMVQSTEAPVACIEYAGNVD